MLFRRHDLHLLVVLFHLPQLGCHESDRGTDVESVPVLVISLESFRWNFVDRIKHLRTRSTQSERRSPFWQLIERGAYAFEGIKSTFSTTSIPNQYTLVTGLYQENHGAISDVVYDPHLDRSIDFRLQKWDENILDGEPIWETLESQSLNESAKFGCHMWIGCDPAMVNKTASFDWTTPWEELVEKIIRWFKEGRRLALVSVPDIDDIGRLHGPDADGMDEALKKLDNNMGYLMNKLKEENLVDRINVIILSGHGMTAARQGQPILPSPFPQYFRVWSRTPAMWLLEPWENTQTQLISYFQQFEHLMVFTKQDIPEEWHYKNNARVPEIMLLAEPGYVLADGQRGLYGYNSSISDMRGTFIGYGPAFLANSTVPPMVSTVDIYELLCLLLDVEAAPNNGSTAHFKSFLRPAYMERRHPAPNATDYSVSMIPVVILLLILVAGVSIGSWLCYRSGECSKCRATGHHDDARNLTADSAELPNHISIKKYDSEIVFLALDDQEVSA